MVGADGRMPLPWLDEPLQRALREQRSHALLVHGPSGVGQFEMARALAQGWLCEAANGTPRPCGRCASCHLVNARSHPDLLVLVPAALREALGWEGDDDEGAEKATKAKPSKEIKVDAVRGAVAFAQSTSARARAKVVVLHPAERMNGIAANTLLKTLEEPPGLARFVLSSGAPDALLPTIRSRCQDLRLTLPPAPLALAWLASQGVDDAEVLLAGAGGQPQDALSWHRAGIDGALWARLPALVQRGEAGALADWPLPLLIDSLTKLCHDLLCTAAGTPPRYFPAAALKGRPPAPAALHAWAAELRRAARHSEHPWNAGLLVDALVAQGAAAAQPRDHSVHSRA